LAATVLGELFRDWGPVARLGEGGIERWMVYPVVLWLVAFGGYLLADPEPPAVTRLRHKGRAVTR